jgi:hypothetical protein
MDYRIILLSLLLIEGCTKGVPSCWENRHALPDKEYRACLSSELSQAPRYVPMPEDRVRFEQKMEQERLFYQYGSGIGTPR